MFDMISSVCHDTPAAAAAICNEADEQVASVGGGGEFSRRTTRRMIPSSPNWYCPHVCDTNKHGLLAMATNQSITVFDISIDSEGSNCPSFVSELSNCSDKVTGVTFHPTQHHILASVSFDGVLCLWDVPSRTSIVECNVLGKGIAREDGKISSVKTPAPEVSSLCWAGPLSTVSTNLTANMSLIVGGKSGELQAWNLRRNGAATMTDSLCPLLSQSVFVMAAAGERLAVGFKNGGLIVMNCSDNGSLSVVQSLRGHDDAIQSLDWKLHNDNGYDSPTLLSAARDRTVRVWSSNNSLNEDKDNDYFSSIAFLIMQGGKGEGGGGGAARVWIAAVWDEISKDNSMRTMRIWVTSSSGELFYWDVDTTQSTRRQRTSGSCCSGQGHSRVVFRLSSFGSRLVSVSMDRQIIIWDPPSLSSHMSSLAIGSSTAETNSSTVISPLVVSHCIPSLGGFAHALSESASEPGVIAIGVGDSRICLWSILEQDSWDCTAVWKGLQSKVTDIATSSSSGSRVAFGTNDGRVGVYNNVRRNRYALFSSDHSDVVYRVCFQPKTNFVWSCGGDGKLLRHDDSAPGNRALRLSDVILNSGLITGTGNSETTVTGKLCDMAWHASGKIVAVAGATGTVDIFSVSLQNSSWHHVAAFACHRRPINSLAWTPFIDYYNGETSESSGSGVQHYLLASGSDDNNICLYDCTDFAGSTSSSDSSTRLPSTVCLRVLRGHCRRVTCISWSPHILNRLASASYDGSVQIWDTSTYLPIANFRGHGGRVMSVIWSLTCSDELISGGDDQTVRVWSVNDQQFKEPPELPALPKKKKKKANANGNGNDSEKVIATNNRPSPDQIAVVSETTSPSRVCQESQLTVVDTNICLPITNVSTSATPSASPSSTTMPTTVNVSPAPEDSKFSMKKKCRRSKTVLPLSSSTQLSREHEQLACVQLARARRARIIRTCSPDTTDTNTVLSSDELLFGSSSDSVLELLRRESAAHLQSARSASALVLDVWSGRLAETVAAAIESDSLTDTIVAMSPALGHNVWVKVARLYAWKCAASGDIHGAVNLLLVTGATTDAISVYQRAGLHVDAMALARLRLAHEDPALTAATLVSARAFERLTAFEQAAKCYLSLGMIPEACFMLTRGGGVNGLAAACCVVCDSTKDDNRTLIVTLATRCAEEAMRVGMWSCAARHFAMSVVHCGSMDRRLALAFTAGAATPLSVILNVPPLVTTTSSLVVDEPAEEVDLPVHIRSDDDDCSVKGAEEFMALLSTKYNAGQDIFKRILGEWCRFGENLSYSAGLTAVTLELMERTEAAEKEPIVCETRSITSTRRWLCETIAMHISRALLLLLESEDDKTATDNWAIATELVLRLDIDQSEITDI